MDLRMVLATTYGWVSLVVIGAIVIAALVGAAMAATTRDDAYDAADRKSKWVWAGLLAVSAVMVMFRMPFLSWAALVIIGLWWFDVRPQIRDILNGNYGW